MGVASGCGCKEVYTFPHITYPYSFLQQHPYFLFIIKILNKKMLFFSFLVINLIIFSHSISTHTGDYGRAMAAI